MSVDKHQACLICATISLAIFEIEMSVAKVKVPQNRHVCDQSEKTLQALFCTYPIQLLVRQKHKNCSQFSVRFF